MSSTLEPSTSPTDTRRSDERKQSPPAFLDLADSAARLGANIPDISARVELKRMEHERQRLIQRKLFEDQMRALEHQQAQELLSIPIDGNAGNSMSHLAVSAPTTPPRVNALLSGEISPGSIGVDLNILSHAVGRVDARKFVSYAANATLSPDVNAIMPNDGSDSRTYSRTAGAKSMPASRRTSASSHDEDLAGHLQGLSVNDKYSIPHSATATTHAILRHGNGDFGDMYEKGRFGMNAGLMLDEQLDQEMHNAMRNLPTSENDKFVSVRGPSVYSRKLSVSSAALDLAPLSQTPPRGSMASRASALESREQPSEWPQFSGAAKFTEPMLIRNEQQRSVTTPQLSLSSTRSDLTSALSGSVSASGTPHIQQHITGLSRRSSPLGISITSGRSELSGMTKTPTTPLSAVDSQSLSHRLSQHGVNQLTEAALSNADLSASLSRISPGQYENDALGYTSMQPVLDNTLQHQQYDESIYGFDNGVLDDNGYSGYHFDSAGRVDANAAAGGSAALYQNQGSRYGLGMNVRLNGAEGKMNGLHGPKHKRGDADRDFNRFAGTRLEDLQGEIANLCKDQHGCRYLQKKLEEGAPEHRDMIFRETFGHFADLMTDPFGNYLCQKLLEFSTDDQRNVICESVAQDLVNISLNMHGTRAVQKMIDFLSTQRQTDLRYNTQIHSIIVALSLHVVVLIKDLNGNHVIQKCLNKLAPEDNQFIYNAVAANCVEVATHRHGCCVLQRCVDHASESQRVQLVNEITYNALTLVQDPYGNYVVQYILDLNENRFSDGVIRQFTGNICALSVQKFSSNVMEKCIRVAETGTRKIIIEELLNRTRLEKLLRDSFGNYCVQTALDYADPVQRNLLVEGIRPILPLIRNTPYGKRIQSKLQREQLDVPNGSHFAYPNQQHAQANSVHTGQGLNHNAHGMHGYGHGHGHAQPQHGHNYGHGHGHNHGHNRHAHHQNTYPHASHHQQASRHTVQIADVYNSQNALYNLGRNGVDTHAHGHQTAVVHGQQTPQSVQAHHSIDGYVLQGDSPHNHGVNTTTNGFNNVAAYSTLPAVHSYGNSLEMNGNMNGNYHRPSFGYGI